MPVAVALAREEDRRRRRRRRPLEIAGSDGVDELTS